MADAPEASGSPKVTIVIGGTPYSINPQKIPYLRAFIHLQTSSGLPLVHDTIPYFDAVFAGIEKGYRHCFRQRPMNLEVCHGICETLDFLCVNDRRLGRSSGDLSLVLNRLRSWEYGLGTLHEMTFIKKADVVEWAQDTAFELVYTMLMGNFEEGQVDSARLYNAEMYIVSHPEIFNDTTRMIVRAAYEERFFVSEKQLEELHKCWF